MTDVWSMRSLKRAVKKTPLTDMARAHAAVRSDQLQMTLAGSGSWGSSDNSKMHRRQRGQDRSRERDRDRDRER